MPKAKVSHRTMIRRVIGAGLLAFVLGVPVAFLGVSYLRSHGALATSPQAVVCLPWDFLIEITTPPKHLHVGEIVLAHTPKAFHNAPLGKLVIGLPGDVIHETRHAIYINGHYWGRMWLYHWLKVTHRLAPRLPQTYTIPKGHVLLLGTASESWDGRYWGIIPVSDIYGTVIPL